MWWDERGEMTWDAVPVVGGAEDTAVRQSLRHRVPVNI